VESGITAVPAEMKATLAKFQSWRETRPSRVTRIPEALWAEATLLARRLGCYPVGQILRLNYNELRRRVGMNPGPVTPVIPEPPAFVTLPRADFLGEDGGPGPVAEVTRPDGCRMVLRWPAGSMVDPRELLVAFLAISPSQRQGRWIGGGRR
jgi:hypothetical protein